MKNFFIILASTALFSTIAFAVPKCYDGNGGDNWCMDNTVSQPYANITDAVLAAKEVLTQAQYSECKKRHGSRNPYPQRQVWQL